MKKTILVFATAIFVLLVAGSVFAYQYGYRKNTKVLDREAVEKAIESGDYAAWKALHEKSNGKMASLITEQNFHLLKEMHEARENGDFKKVQEIKAQLGFPKGSGVSKGMGKAYMNCPCAK